MTHGRLALLTTALCLVASSGAVLAGGPDTARSAIFGKASIQKLSAEENKAVVGRGAYADYYGYYGNYYASVASNYGYYGYYYNPAYYYYAASNALAAYNNYSYANYYGQRGL